MNLTEIIIRQMNSGQLQVLAAEIIKKKRLDIANIENIGGVEGTEKTRKGTPDIIGFKSDKSEVYIEVTNDRVKGKIKKDVQKCIEKGVDRPVVEIISILGFTPDFDEIKECEKLCVNANIKYSYYTNSMLSKIIDTELPELKSLYINSFTNSNIIEIDLFGENYINQLDSITKELLWITEEQKKDVYRLLYELITNAFSHGQASSVKLFFDDSSIRLTDDGNPFCLEKFVPINGVNGGKYTFDYFYDKYSGELFYHYSRGYNKNNNIISLKKCEEICLEAESCVIEIPYFQFGPREIIRRNYILTNYNDCNPLILKMNDMFPPMSIVRELIDEIIVKIASNIEIVIQVKEKDQKFLNDYLVINKLIERVKISCY